MVIQAIDNSAELLHKIEQNLKKKKYAITKPSSLKDGEIIHHGIVDIIAVKRNDVQIHRVEDNPEFMYCAREKLKLAMKIYHQNCTSDLEKEVTCYLNNKKVNV